MYFLDYYYNYFLFLPFYYHNYYLYYFIKNILWVCIYKVCMGLIFELNVICRASLFCISTTKWKKGCMYEWQCFKYLDGGQYFSGGKKFLHSGLMVNKKKKREKIIVYRLKNSEYFIYSDFTNDWGRQSPAFLIEIYFMLKFANAWPFFWQYLSSCIF